MKVALLNAPVMTNYGVYSYQPLSIENARLMLQVSGFESFIGHESTAIVLSTLFGLPIKVNRAPYIQQGGMIAIVFSLNKRLDGVRDLSLDELKKIGYTLGVVKRVDVSLEALEETKDSVKQVDQEFVNKRLL